MVEPAFTPEIERALHAYAVPPIPQGFSDRLMARITSSETGISDESVALPTSRTNRASPWRRTGRVIGVVATFSLATATAAAAGVFGEPLYVPGVSEALVEAKIVKAPTAVAKPRVRIMAQNKTEEALPTIGSAAVVDRVTELRTDPDFAKLPPRQRLGVATREVRRMVSSGEVTRDEARTAVRALGANADPATKEAWRKAATERREQRLERRERFRDAAPNERAAMVQELRQRRQAREQALAPPASPSPPAEGPSFE